MKDGVLHIAIVEAVYGQIVVKNHSRIDTAQLQVLAARLHAGQRVDQVPLERSLLLLQELAGVGISTEASPGTAPGSTDLTITAKDTARVTGSFGLDNQGSDATGRLRAHASVNLNNQLGRGEVFNVLTMSSGENLNYGRLGLQMPVNALGTRIGVGYALLRYELGDVFRALQAHGSARVFNGLVQHALVRSTSFYLNADFALENKLLQDRVDITGSRNDRHISSVTLGLSGEQRDKLWGVGASRFLFGYSRGRVRFDDAAALALDQSSAGANTQNGFARWNLTLARTQNLGEAAGTSLFASVRAQGANKNLDASEQIGIGGPYGVRGYDNNALPGAQGYVASLELRHWLARNASGAWLGKVFVDTGHATVYKTPFTTLPNKASLHGAGLGLVWTGPRGWNAQPTLAQPVGAAPTIAAERARRLWLQLGGQF